MRTIVVVEDLPGDLARITAIVRACCPADKLLVFTTLEEGIHEICDKKIVPDRAILDMGISQDSSAGTSPDIKHGVDLLVHLVSTTGISTQNIRIVTQHPESVEKLLAREDREYRAEVISKGLYPAEYRRQLENFLAP